MHWSTERREKGRQGQRRRVCVMHRHINCTAEHAYKHIVRASYASLRQSNFVRVLPARQHFR
eukprot:365792-Chlamydomonas_euryale.AAC.5